MMMKSKMTKRLFQRSSRNPLPQPALPKCSPPPGSLILTQMAMAHSSPWTHQSNSFPLPHWMPSCSLQHLYLLGHLPMLSESPSLSHTPDSPGPSTLALGKTGLIPSLNLPATPLLMRPRAMYALEGC